MFSLDKKMILEKYKFIKESLPQVDVKVVSDIHYSPSFDYSKLSTILDVLNATPTNYVCIPGDLLDSTDVLNNYELRIKLLDWLNYLANQYQTFLTLGSHDIAYRQDNKWNLDYPVSFLEDVKDMGINLGYFTPYYEDDNLIVYQLDLPLSYYYSNNGDENVNILISTLENIKEDLVNLNNKKLKIFICHSPLFLTNEKVLEYLQEFDLLISGHMHNGMLCPFIPSLNHILGNYGLISPNKKLFPDNAKGIKEINVNNHNLYLIVSGGITKIQDCAPKILRWGNGAFAMQMDDILVNGPTLKRSR